MAAQSKLARKHQTSATSASKENEALRKSATTAPAASTKKGMHSADGPLTQDTNGKRERSQRQKKPTTKVEMYIAQEQAELEHRRQAAERKAIRAQRNAPDTDIEDDHEDLENGSGEEDNMFTTRPVTTKLSKVAASGYVRELPLVHTEGRVPITPHKPSEDDNMGWTDTRGRRQVSESLTASREASPDLLETRKRRSPSTESLRDTKLTKSSSGSRPKAADYDDISKACIAGAIGFYRCLISTRTPFPDHVEEIDLCRQAWTAACEDQEVELILCPDIAKLITNRGSHTRGELKTKARPIVEMFYQFESGQNKKIVKKNRDMAEDLKDGYGYAYKVHAAEQAARRGLYQSKIIQQIINAMWFRNRRDEGVRYEEFFRPIKPETIALVLTVTECCIDEWVTGIHTDAPFTAISYRDVFVEHLRCLSDFINHTKKHGLFENICEKLYNHGRFHAGAQPVSQLAIRTIPTSAFDAAIQEYDEDSETETDGEGGDSS